MYNNLPKTLFVGKSVIYLPTCHSTNDIASSLLGKPEILEGTVVICSHQTAGKGQRGNSWEAEPNKNLTLSLILKPGFLKANQQFNLNIAISLAVYDLLGKYLGETVKVKWPNDIYYTNPQSGKSNKICGILIQNTIKKDNIENAIVGIGLNVNQQMFTDGKAASLSNIIGSELDLEVLFPDLMEKIEGRYIQLRENSANLLNQYLKSLYWYKELRTFKSGETFQGTIVGLDEIGRLIVETPNGLRVFSFKEVEFIE